MENYRIGWGREEISLDEPVSLPGQMYIRVSEGIMDPLYATALCIDNGRDAVIFCTLEIVVLRNHITDAIREKIAELCSELPLDKIIFNTTHTHSGIGVVQTPEKTPDGREIYPGEKAKAHVAERAAKAVADAWKSRKEGGIAYGYSYATVAHSRRTCYYVDTSKRKLNYFAPNGTSVMYGDTNDPDFSHFEAGTEAMVNLLFTTDKAGKLTGIVANIPCPSQICESMLVQTADYWADIREAVAGEYGKDIFVLPQCAAAGDLSPRTLYYRGAEARRMHLKYGIDYNMDGYVFAPELVGRKPLKGHPSEDFTRRALAVRKDIAERVMFAIRDACGWALKDVQYSGSIRHHSEVMQLTRREITEQDAAFAEASIAFAKSSMMTEGDPAEISHNNSRMTALINRNVRALDTYHALKEDPTYPTTVHMVQLGEIAFATTQFELYLDYMHRIQARSPFIQTFVVELAGCEDGSYLPTARGIAGRGYSASIYCNRVGSDAGREYVERVLSVLQDFAGQKPVCISRDTNENQFDMPKEKK